MNEINDLMKEYIELSVERGALAVQYSDGAAAVLSRMKDVSTRMAIIKEEVFSKLLHMGMSKVE